MQSVYLKLFCSPVKYSGILSVVGRTDMSLLSKVGVLGIDVISLSADLMQWIVFGL